MENAGVVENIKTNNELKYSSINKPNSENTQSSSSSSSSSSKTSNSYTSKPIFNPYVSSSIYWMLQDPIDEYKYSFNKKVNVGIATT